MNSRFFIYNEENETILIREPGPLSKPFLLFPALFGFLTGVVFLKETLEEPTIGKCLFAVFCFLFTIGYMVFLFLAAKNGYILLTKEGITACDLFGKKLYLPWAICNYVDLTVMSAGRGLVCSQQSPPRDAHGNVPLYYRWNYKCTISLDGLWDLLTTEQQQLVLRFVGVIENPT